MEAGVIKCSPKSRKRPKKQSALLTPSKKLTASQKNSESPSPTNIFKICHISEYPIGRPLETPLTPPEKRKRVWRREWSPDLPNEPSTSLSDWYHDHEEPPFAPFINKCTTPKSEHWEVNNERQKFELCGDTSDSDEELTAFPTPKWQRKLKFSNHNSALHETNDQPTKDELIVNVDSNNEEQNDETDERLISFAHDVLSVDIKVEGSLQIEHKPHGENKDPLNEKDNQSHGEPHLPGNKKENTKDELVPIGISDDVSLKLFVSNEKNDLSKDGESLLTKVFDIEISMEVNSDRLKEKESDLTNIKSEHPKNKEYNSLENEVVPFISAEDDLDCKTREVKLGGKSNKNEVKEMLVDVLLENKEKQSNKAENIKIKDKDLLACKKWRGKEDAINRNEHNPVFVEDMTFVPMENVEFILVPSNETNSQNTDLTASEKCQMSSKNEDKESDERNRNGIEEILDDDLLGNKGNYSKKAANILLKEKGLQACEERLREEDAINQDEENAVVVDNITFLPSDEIEFIVLPSIEKSSQNTGSTALEKCQNELVGHIKANEAMTDDRITLLSNPAFIVECSQPFLEIFTTQSVTTVDDIQNAQSQSNSFRLYSIEWSPFPDIPIPPNDRRETFDSSKEGSVTEYLHPYTVFTAIWNKAIIRKIVTETNRYGNSLTEITPNGGIVKKTWVNTNHNEIYVYLAILLAMGIVVKSKLADYWNEDDIFSTPGFSHYMSLARFNMLSEGLHFNNNEELLSITIDHDGEAKIFKLQPIIDHLNGKFSTLYNLGQNIALDDSLLTFKDNFKTRVVTKDKTEKLGVNSCSVCEAHTGYVWRFELFPHKSLKAGAESIINDPNSKAFLKHLVDLLKGLENKGHTLFMNKDHNSPQLARKLKYLGFDCVGPFKTDDKTLPAEIVKLIEQDTNPGKITGLTSGDVDVMLWQERDKRIAILSTYHGDELSETENGERKPMAVKDYNICMGELDKKDKILSTYHTDRSGKQVWYKKVFTHLLNVSVLNAHVIYLSCCQKRTKPENKPLTHLDFRTSLVKYILSKHLKAQPKITIAQSFSKKLVNHYPAMYDSLSTSSRQRKKCVVCRKTTQYCCVGCNKPACILSCYRYLHSSTLR